MSSSRYRRVVASGEAMSGADDASSAAQQPQPQPPSADATDHAPKAEGSVRSSAKRRVARTTSPLVEADPPSAVPATEERLPSLWRTTEELPPRLQAQARGRMPPARQPLDDELLAAAAHDAGVFRADQTMAYHEAHRTELEQDSVRRKAEAEELKARAEEAKLQRQAAVETRHRAAAAAIREARAVDAEAKLEREAMRAAEASREEEQKRLRCEKARQLMQRRQDFRDCPPAAQVATARLTTKLRTPSPPPHYASPRQNAGDHVLRPAPTTSAVVALARATVGAERRTPAAHHSALAASAAVARPRRSGARPASSDRGDARFKLTPTDATGWSMLPPSPRSKVGILPTHARLLMDATTAAEMATTAETAITVESTKPATKPTTPTTAGYQQGHGLHPGGSPAAGPSQQLAKAYLAPTTPGLGPWDDSKQKSDGGVMTDLPNVAKDSTAGRRESAGTLARRICSPRQVDIRPVVAARSARARPQHFVTGQPANIRTSMAKRETAAAAAAAPRSGRDGLLHGRSSAFSPRSREHIQMVSPTARSQVQPRQKQSARSAGHRTAHGEGQGGVGVYASAIDMSPWLGDELDPSPAVVGF
eukprot:COSAG02_NODE_3345_length_6897_cov_4.834951_4_plen_595_part_00